MLLPLLPLAAIVCSTVIAGTTGIGAFSPVARRRIAREQSQSRTYHHRNQCLWLAPQQLGSFETLDISKEQAEKRKVAVFDLSGEDPMSFEEAWEWQKSILEGHVYRLSSSADDDPGPFLGYSDYVGRDISGVDTVIMLQHSPVYTLGTGSDEKFVLTAQRGDGSVPVVRMDRGGEVTYHGPGQLTIYPIFDLRNYKQDIHWYMRALEEAVLIALLDCGLERAERQDDITGIWIDNLKVAAVGIKCRKWISMHGLVVNVEHESLENFEGIVPCGLAGRGVGCLNQYLDEPITVSEFAGYMKRALEHVFRIQLVDGAIESR